MLSFGLALQTPSLAQAPRSPAQERIGIYDSRAVAVAFAGSPARAAQLADLKAQHQQAKAAGDRAALARFEAEGKARQAKAHAQAFSTAPVDDILVHLAAALPEIQKVAAVSAIVSKWDEAALARHPGAERVDVTPLLIDALHPNERQRKSAIDIQRRQPIPLERAQRIKD